MDNENKPHGESSTIFTRGGFITESGDGVMLGPEEANLEYQALQFFLEESYYTLCTKHADKDIQEEVNRAIGCFGLKTTAEIAGCEEDELFLAFDFTDDKWRQKTSKKLTIARYWVTTNNMLSPPEATMGSEGDSKMDDVGQARHTLACIYPELGDIRSVAEFIRDERTLFETIETLNSILWSRYNGWE